MLVMFFSFPLRKDSKQLGEAVSTFFFINMFLIKG